MRSKRRRTVRTTRTCTRCRGAIGGSKGSRMCGRDCPGGGGHGLKTAGRVSMRACGGVASGVQHRASSRDEQSGWPVALVRSVRVGSSSCQGAVLTSTPSQLRCASKPDLALGCAGCSSAVVVRSAPGASQVERVGKQAQDARGEAAGWAAMRAAWCCGRRGMRRAWQSHEMGRSV
jgi:hypothetical protein